MAEAPKCARHAGDMHAFRAGALSAEMEEDVHRRAWQSSAWQAAAVRAHENCRACWRMWAASGWGKQDFAQGLGEGTGLDLFDEAPEPISRVHFGNSADAAGDHGQTAGERLEDDIGNALVFARKKEHVRRLHVACNARGIGAPGEDDAVV